MPSPASSNRPASARGGGGGEFDAVVVGGGAIGLAAALALAKEGARTALLEARGGPALSAPSADLRATALNRESCAFLEGLGLGDGLAGAGEPIRRVAVAEARLGRGLVGPLLEIGGEGGAPSGLMIPNSQLLALLWEQAGRCPGLRVFFSARAADFKAERGGEVVLESGLVLSAPLVVAADGRRSRLRELARIPVRTHDYRQTALVGALHHEKPHRGTALELFLPEGPLAFLPLPSSPPPPLSPSPSAAPEGAKGGAGEGAGEGGGGGAAHRSAFVWSLRQDLAEAAAESPAAFLEPVFTRLAASQLGACRLAGPVQSWPLSLARARDFSAPGLALVGDAARALHPVAGQGLNLGLRDARSLASLAGAAMKAGGPEGLRDPGLLLRYARLRRRDSLALTAFTDGIVRLFALERPAVVRLRRLGLAAVGRSARARRFFLASAGGGAG